MSQANKALPQSKEALLKSYTKRMKDDIKSMVESYTEMIKLGKVIREKSRATCSSSI